MIYAINAPGGSEWLIILLVVLVLFGGSQLPKLARSLGQAQKELKKGMQEGLRDDEDEKDQKKA
ncbi:MAG: twin-arginine translocase TatA/TatE family subunit [Acidimicrobiales bacterium]